MTTPPELSPAVREHLFTITLGNPEMFDALEDLVLAEDTFVDETDLLHLEAFDIPDLEFSRFPNNPALSHKMMQNVLSGKVREATFGTHLLGL